MEVGAFGAAGPRARKHVTQAPTPGTEDVTTLTPCMEEPCVAALHYSLRNVTQTGVQVMACGALKFPTIRWHSYGHNFPHLFVYSNEAKFFEKLLPD
jgi:hypothetical protein